MTFNSIKENRAQILRACVFSPKSKICKGRRNGVSLFHSCAEIPQVNLSNSNYPGCHNQAGTATCRLRWLCFVPVWESSVDWNCVCVCVCFLKIEPHRRWFVFGGTDQIGPSCLHPLFHGEVRICVFWLCLCLCVCASVSCTQHGILIPGPNPVILRLSHFVKCSSHSLNSSHSLVASNVNPDAHKQHLSKWHLIHYTPPHTKKGECTHVHADISGTEPKLRLNSSLKYQL